MRAWFGVASRGERRLDGEDCIARLPGSCPERRACAAVDVAATPGADAQQHPETAGLVASQMLYQARGEASENEWNGRLGC